MIVTEEKGALPPDLSRARTVIVTGAAGTLGRAVAKAFGGVGANLVLIDREESALRSAFDNAGENMLLCAARLDEPAAAIPVVEQAVERFGAIDVLCNVAGGFYAGDCVHEMRDETWDLLTNTNARTVLHMAQAVIPKMIAARYGKVINVAAMAAQAGMAHMGAYCASKSAVLRLTEAMSAELRGHGINVNSVMPSIIDTAQNRKDMPDADFATWVRPVDLACIILFLASDDARAIHGAGIPVRGAS
ncbi:short chain dehydrogenase family protein [Paraburkholderia xenovorans LB400]|uniref:Short-chain dehydrogenase/reductase SDR n=1 Tax=Paraburkholderia xenovorans (strain LB400) TaxID=266265 RepID=Q143T9_PARXL|nr:SDR family NAD(P)-dependent oxidoreductase [Paraburkholderia xenovorans]ABE29400.1 Putative short-chain dehydrogenase/reductase SDR [Paraburkholderia xenovorans LB400]AIP33735.1 short chain dehydrogenase family protein [Paraburkholderia xenovorans LB400]